MGNSEKVWVIPASSKRSRSKKTDKAVDPELEERLSSLGAGVIGGGGGGKGKKAGGSSRAPSDFVSVISYFLGPFSILAAGKGRKSGFWLSILALSVLSFAVFGAGLLGWFDMDGSGAWVFQAWVGSAVAGVVLGAAAWSRGLVLAQRQSRPAFRLFPGFMRSPWGAGALGIVFPGFGLYSTGRPRRAAAAVWPAAFIALSAIILFNSKGLWNSAAGAQSYGYGGRFLEYVFITAAVLGFLGVVFWIFQALDGARLASCAGGGKARAGGDLAAAMLLISMIAFGLMFQNDYVAESLHARAGEMFDDGYRVIPVYIESAAVRIDRSRPEYSIRLMEFYEGVDETEKARTVRSDLVSSLVACAGFIRESGIARLSDYESNGQMKAAPNTPPGAGETVILSGPDLINPPWHGPLY